MLDPTRETFALAYHETGSGAEAFRRAKPEQAKRWKAKTVHEHASRMLADGKVRARLQELQKEAASAHEITVDSIARELEEARTLGKSNAQASAMVAASMGKAKLVGLLIDKAEVTGKDGQPLVPVLNVTLA